MINDSINELCKTIVSGLGLSNVFYCEKSHQGFNREFVNYGFIKPQDNDSAMDYVYEQVGGCEYAASGSYILFIDLHNCNDKVDAHDKVVSYMMGVDEVSVTGSGHDMTDIFELDTGTTDLWEDDNVFIAVWFDYQDDVSCRSKSDDYKIC